MPATATQRLSAATPPSMWMSYDVPSEEMKCPKGSQPATSVTAPSTTSGRVIVQGASWGVWAAWSSRFSRPQKMP